LNVGPDNDRATRLGDVPVGAVGLLQSIVDVHEVADVEFPALPVPPVNDAP
jgi:hypothetical protein